MNIQSKSMKKWEEFLDLTTSLTPHEIISELKTLLGIKVTHELYDSITDELHFNFKFEGYRFSFHNPYGGGYGYWFFYNIRRNKPKITKKLKKLIKEHFEV